jgi:uncharacterized membrane protein YqgA involved in biofilm formation
MVESGRMTGTEFNVAGIILGGIAGIAMRRPPGATTQNVFKNVLGAATFGLGVHLMWISLRGTFLELLVQTGILLLALITGRLIGKLLRLQKMSNRIGQFARERMASARPDNPNRFSDGFKVCAALLCAAPLGIVGAVHDGLSGYFYPLVVKGVMDGLAVISFVMMFGSGVVLSAIPVLLLQGSITLICARWLLPVLEAHELVHYVNAAGGFMLLCVALLIFQIRKVHVADYFPALLLAPLLGWWLG